MRFPLNEYGTPLCPVLHTSWVYLEDSGDQKIPSSRACGEEVWLAVDLAVPIVPGGVVPMDEVAKLATSSAWKVECAAGHVFAISDGEEMAEDFVWAEIVGP